MLRELNREGSLYQETAAADIETEFGDEFVYTNENGNEFVLYTDFIGIGKTAEFGIRIVGVSSLSVDIIAVHSQPLFFDLAAGSHIVSIWVDEAIDAIHGIQIARNNRTSANGVAAIRR